MGSSRCKCRFDRRRKPQQSFSIGRSLHPTSREASRLAGRGKTTKAHYATRSLRDPWPSGGTGPIHPSFPGLRRNAMPCSRRLRLANSTSSATSSLDAHGKSGFGLSLSIDMLGVMLAWKLGSGWLTNESSSYSLTSSTFRCPSGPLPARPLRTGATLRPVSLLGVTLRLVGLT